jgi:hypothetical protein
MPEDSPLPLKIQEHEDPVEAVTQGFATVTLVVIDKPPDKPTERTQTPRTFNDEDRK